MILNARISDEDKKKLTESLYKPFPEEIIQKIKDIYNYMAETGTCKFMCTPREGYRFEIELKNLKEEKAKEVWYGAPWKNEIHVGEIQDTD